LYRQECAKLPELCYVKIEETPVVHGDRPANDDDLKVTVKAGGYRLRNTQARRGRVQETFLKSYAAGVAVGTKAKRPSRRRQPLIASTPMDPMRLPPVITPKVKDGADFKCRALKPEEVAFSLSGSPVLTANPVNDDVQHIAHMLQVDEEQLTPETRRVVHGLKTVIRKVHVNA
uniref:Borealin domain-containing protein n=1 Tax=Toxocara canis TaxID=6265 RepID=A0A183UVN1_TOXCA